MALDFFLPGEPPTSTAQQKGLATRRIWKNGRAKTVPYAYETKNIKSIREWFAWQLAPYKPKEPHDGPVRLVTIWKWQATKTHKPGTWRDTRPDTDNIIKLFKDTLADLGFFSNDSRVVDDRQIKIWSKRPGIRVYIDYLPRTTGGQYDDENHSLSEENQEEQPTGII